MPENFDLIRKIMETVLKEIELDQLRETMRRNAERMIGEYRGNEIVVEEGTGSNYQAQAIPAERRKRKRLTDGAIRAMRRVRVSGLSWYETTWQNSQLFTAQARFLAPYWDDYPRRYQYTSYSPNLNELSNGQLRTYVTWRTAIRKGSAQKIQESYVRIYCYELLNLIGTGGREEALEQLVLVWNHYGRGSETFGGELLDWIRSFYIVNGFEEDFESFIRKNQMEVWYGQPEEEKETPSFDEIIRLSGYPYENSKFIQSGYQESFRRCTEAVVRNLEPLLDLYGLRARDLFRGREIWQRWRPFRDIPYYEGTPEIQELWQRETGDRTVTVLGKEFKRVQGEWYEKAEGDLLPGVREVMRYLLKDTEAYMRKLAGHKYRLQPKLPELSGFMERNVDWSRTGNLSAAIRDESFEILIEGAVRQAWDRQEDGMDLTWEAREVRRLAGEYPYYELRRMRMLETEGLSANTLFVRQARFLGGIQDTDGPYTGIEEGVLKFELLTNAQLRSYLAWKERYAGGDKGQIGRAYLYFYAAELVNDTGDRSPQETAAALADLMRDYKDLYGELETLAPSWIRDYYVTHPFNEPFGTLASKLRMEEYYPWVYLDRPDCPERFAYLMKQSSYKPETGRFWDGKTGPVIRDCFCAAMERVREYFDAHGQRLYEVLTGYGEAKRKQAFFDRLPYEFLEPNGSRRVKISSIEEYQIGRRGVEVVSYPQGNSPASHIIGYVLKRTEACLRQVMGFRYKMSPDREALLKGLPKGKVNPDKVVEILSRPDFDSMIDQAVMERIRRKYPQLLSGGSLDQEPVLVEIDLSRLDAIRRQSDENLKKLLIEPEELPDASENEAAEEERSEEQEREQGSEKDEWDSFFDSLTAAQREVFRLVLAGDQEIGRIKEIADRTGILAESLIDAMNECAAETVGDSVFEISGEKVGIYEDYRDILAAKAKEWKME